MPLQPFLPGMGGAAGAHRMGRAHGVIEIDTSPLRRGLMEVKRVGQQMGDAFKGMRTQIRNVNDDISKMRRELGMISAGAGLLTGIGLAEARTLRQYRITFTQLLGDVDSANRLMEDLTKEANRFGIEVNEVWQLGRALLPVLDDGAETLDEWVKRAALLASTNPLKGTTDAVRAIQEYLAGQPRSLQYLFNVPPELIQEAKQQYQDVGDQLDYILRQMGATETAAEEMANAWIGVRNELKLTLAEGFTPLLEGLRPILTDFREFISTLRDTHPELLNIAAGFTVFTGTATTTLLVLNQVLGALQKIKGLSIAPALGAVGAYAGALAIGTAGGLAVSRGIGRATGRQDMAQENLQSIIETLKQAVIVAVDTWTKASATISIKLFDLARDWANAVSQMIASIGDFIIKLGRSLRIEKLEEVGQRLKTGAMDNIERWDNAVERFTESVVKKRREFVEAVGRFVMPEVFPQQLGPREIRSLLSGTAGGGPGGAGGYTEDQLAAIRQWHERRQEIIENTEQQINEVTEQYERQRASTIRNFNKTMAREAEDWARQQERRRRELERNIADIYQSRAEREAQWAEDLGKRIVEMQENANRQLRRLQEEHRLTLLDAASRLDARAVAQEQRRYRQRRRQINEDLEQRIDQEQEAHAERLKAARQADEERIEDMKEAYKEQQRLDEEDRRIRLERMVEDHRDQLREMDDQHQRRIDQIQQQGWREREQFDQEFQQELIQLGLHQDSWLEAQEAGQRASLRSFELWWAELQSKIQESRGIIGGRQAGGPVTTTGAYMLHGTQSRPEYVLSAETTRFLQGALGGTFTQRDLVGAVAGAEGSSKSVTVQSGAFPINIQGTSGQSAVDIADEVKAAIMEVFVELGR